MKVLFGGLFLETAGLAWDIFRHVSGLAEGEGLVAPSHAMIFAGFAVSFIGAILVHKKIRGMSM